MKKLVFLVMLLALVAIPAFTWTGQSSAKQNCLAWERSMRSSAGANDHAGVGRPAIDRLAGDEPYGRLLGDWVADNCMRLNHVQVLGTHNSYHIEPRPALLALIASIDPAAAASMEYTHRPLDEQFGPLGIRQVELDVFADPDGGLFAVPLGPILVQGFPDPIKPELEAPGLKVLHVQDIDFETTCLTFVSCLQTIKAWSDANPGHLPLMVLVEAKDDPLLLPPGALPPGVPPPAEPVPFGAPELDGIDAEIRSVFSDDQLITPDDVRGGRDTLEQAVLKDGWPTLNESRGRLLFALDNTDAKRDDYLAGHPSLAGRVMFTSSPAGSPESAFVKVNDPVPNQAFISELVAAGYIVRTRADADTVEARFGLTARRDAALASGAQFVSTDYPEPDPDFSTGYFVEIAGGMNARCNPILSPPGCNSSALED
ncbi:MAG: phosphatidylinositol-specific phospholipase C1-like protein [Gemmatimonadota bacterium]